MPIQERISMIWNSASSCEASRPAIAIVTISVSQPSIHNAARDVDEKPEVEGIGEAAVIAQNKDSAGPRGRIDPPLLFEVRVGIVAMQRVWSFSLAERKTAIGRFR